MSDFFSPIGNTKPYFKAGLQGFTGSGKTTTAALIAIGIHKKIGSKKPVIMFDTERGSKFLKHYFDDVGIEVLIKESKSLADLSEAMKQMRNGLSDVLIIDSITHIWNNFIEAYKAKKNRAFFTIQDWGVLKPAWAKEFSEPFVNDPYHVIMCGRAGEVFDSEINEETGKREMFVSGVKMKAEKETAYEPDILVHMELAQVLDGKNIRKVVRTATVLKDRSTLIDGKVFENPTFANFEPVVDALLTDPKERSTVAERDAADLIKTEEGLQQWKRDKEKALEEIQGYLSSVWPSRGAEETKLKTDAIFEAFNTRSWTAVEESSPEKLRVGLVMIQEFVKKHIESKKQEIKPKKK